MGPIIHDRPRNLPRLVAITIACLTVAPLSALAWQAPAAGVISIAEVRERAETGDYLVVEGTVVEQRDKTLFRIDDETGSMWVLIPNFVLRDEGVPARSEQIRVAGKYDNAKLDKSLQGVRVMTLWRGLTMNDGRGKPHSEAAGKAPSQRSAAPPAAADAGSPGAESSSGKPNVIQPSAGAEFVEKASAARADWLAALAELEEASTAYGRALYEAGDDGRVDATVRSRNEAAEARVARSTEKIQALVAEARRDGVPEDVLRLYVQMTTRSR